MNKGELIVALADKTGVSKKDAEKVLNAFIETVQETVKANDKVQLVGFGTFESRVRGARIGINPQTKATVEIPACKIPAFRAGKVFKELFK